MRKRVVVVASGETERRSLPHLFGHLEGADIMDVRVPPRNLPLTPDMAERLIKASWFSSQHQPPHKFVVLVDVDHGVPESVLDSFKEKLPSRITMVNADLLYAFAQHHLEAWYFADSAGLRRYLGRSLGSVDASLPDQIENPKLHLKHLLGDRIYTARVSQEIAQSLDADTITQRSPSFNGFHQAVLNGAPVAD